MELDVFITKSIESIINGISNATKLAEEKDVIINPFAIHGVKGNSVAFLKEKSKSEGARPISKIEFDIAVTSASKSESGAGGGINVLSVKMSGKTSEQEQNQVVSRIKFDINMTLPKSNND